MGLVKLQIKNLGPIVDDEIDFSDFTFFIGRNNAGKSHYIKAIELLLATKIQRYQKSLNCNKIPRTP